MAEMEIIMINQKELKRLEIIQKVIEGRIKQIDAGKMLGISERQIRRIVKRIREEGEGGIVHRLRGKPSNRRIVKEEKDRVIKLYQEKYKGFGPLLASEKLQEIDKIKVSDETLRRWLIEGGEWKVKRGIREHRQWRERKQYFGEMVQMDGSHHDWLEGRGPELVLMGYIDDATSNVFGQFYYYEGTIPAMDGLKRYIEKYGIPLSIYLDRHTTYKSNAKPTIEDELNDRKPMSQFERAAKELGIEIIHANSPQGKGRIERLFGTFQDRLIKEMRLIRIKTKEEANGFLDRYLPIYNQKFGVQPAKGANLHRAVPKELELDNILCKKTERTLRKDFTISYKKKLYQIKDWISAKKVMVEEHIDGSISIRHKGKVLNYTEIISRAKRLSEKEKSSPHKERKVYIPPKEHPWRKFNIRSYPQYAQH